MKTKQISFNFNLIVYVPYVQQKTLTYIYIFVNHRKTKLISLNSY